MEGNPEGGSERGPSRPDGRRDPRTELTDGGLSGAEGRMVTGTVRTDDIETYYVRRGDGPPVVFVHGAVMNAEQWAAQMDALADEYTTVAYDVRGHGRTGASERRRYSVELYADDLDSLLDALDVERAVLCGLSMGGLIAQVYAARYPETVAGLVLADTFTSDLSAPTERLQFAVLRALVPPVRLVGYERIQRFNAWVHERLNPGATGDYDAIEHVQRSAPNMTTDEFAKVMRSLARFHGTDVDYAAITVPTRVLYGEHVPSFLRRQSEKLAATIPEATIDAVPGGGHASNLDNPEFFTAAVREVLERAFEDGNDEGVERTFDHGDGEGAREV